MTNQEFEQYAKEHNLVVWSKEMSDEAIQALELLPKLRRNINTWREKVHEIVRECNVIEVSKQLTGRWIDKDANGGVKCSVCQKYTLFYEGNYCPNCGAKMKKGEPNE